MLLGTFEDDTDVDVFSFDIPSGMGTRSFNVTFMPEGTEGHGSTTTPGSVWVTNDAADTIIARIDGAAGLNRIVPPLAAGSYLLWVEHPGGGAGANDFYSSKASRGSENDPESSDANETLADAQALTLADDDGDGTRSAFVLATLDSDSDVDYFSVDVMSGEVLSVACGSASVGSGVQDLKVEVRDDSDSVLAEMTEAPPEGVFLDEVTIPSAGTYYVRLSKSGQDTEVTGDWARCGIHAITP